MSVFNKVFDFTLCIFDQSFEVNDFSPVQSAVNITVRNHVVLMVADGNNLSGSGTVRVLRSKVLLYCYGTIL